MTQGTTLHTIGLDLGKWFIQVHGADVKGPKLPNRRLRWDQVAPFFCSAFAGTQAWQQAPMAASRSVRLAWRLKEHSGAYLEQCRR